MEKSADAFRTISEVADDLTLPQHVLRFWETRFPQIRPLKRAGGRRYYRPMDVALLKTIRQLLYDDGYTIKGVQRLLKEQGPKGLTAVPAPDIENVVPEEPDDMQPAATLDTAADGAEDPPKIDGSHRDLFVESIATIEECLRILDAVRRRPS